MERWSLIFIFLLPYLIIRQFVYWSWFSNSLYHGAMGLMNGMSMTQIYDRIADVLMPTQYAQWTFVSRSAVWKNIHICIQTPVNRKTSPHHFTLTVDPGATTEFPIRSRETSTKCCTTDKRCMECSFECVVPSRREKSGRWRMRIWRMIVVIGVFVSYVE